MSAKHPVYCRECGDSIGVCDIEVAHSHKAVLCSGCVQAGNDVEDYFRTMHFASLEDCYAALAKQPLPSTGKTMVQMRAERGVSL